MAVTSPLLEASIEGARGILLNIAGGPDLGLFEVNEAAEIIHSAAHPDANIIFGQVIEEGMGDEVRVTVIAAGFDRFDGAAGQARADDRTVEVPRRPALGLVDSEAEMAAAGLGFGDEDDFDVPPFLK
jgi:cell division protein FtsZ